MSDLLWLIPVFPAIGFLVNGLLGSRLSKRAVSAIACSVIVVSFVLSVLAVSHLVSLPAADRYMENRVAAWVPQVDDGGGAGALRLDWLFVLDPLSAVMILVVTGVGLLIHIYSIGYMWDEPGYWRYFSFLNLFMAMMLTLVLGGSLAVMFVGWEGVGLCSYLLIGYFYWKTDCADAGRKAFMTNRIGDLAFVIGTLTLFAHFGTLEFRPILSAVVGGGGSTALLTTVAICLFVGACGKSAQIPLYVWLPDAMAGPTPVSALIHAATMVTAGVYMVCRLAPMYMAAPIALGIVAVVGVVTALFAATIGLAQNDIKKVLAYSTISQLGYMFVGAGVGAFGAAIFHLTTHAFFKALLFLGSGAVIHALHHEQDMTKMGGLRKHLPTTYAVFICGWVAISGVPFTSGFFSKDEILFNSFLWSPIVWAVGAFTAVLTAFYMTRLMGLTFWGETRMDPHTAEHVHEVPAVMKWPLVILAGLALVGGLLGVPAALGGSIVPFHLDEWLAPVFAPATYAAGAGHAAVALVEHGAAGHGAEHAAPALEYGLMALTSVLALLTMGAGYLLYEKRPGTVRALKNRFAAAYTVLSNKYWVDELYDVVVIQSYYRLCRLAQGADAHLIDGVVHLVRNLTIGVSYLSVFWDTWVVDGMVNLVGRIFRTGSRQLRKFQTGMTQSYATVMVMGMFIMICVYLYLS